MKKMMIATLAAASVLLAVANQAHAGATLDAVQKKGFVQCGISDGLPGFSYADADGKFSGIDVDICRGVAAAVFGDDTKVIIPHSQQKNASRLYSQGKWICSPVIRPGLHLATPGWEWHLLASLITTALAS